MGLYTLGLYEKPMPAELTWEEKLKAAKAAGYDYVEISIDATEDKIRRLEMTKKNIGKEGWRFLKNLCSWQMIWGFVLL